MINIFHKSKKDKTVRQIEDFQIGCWVNVTNPTEEEIFILSDKFKLDKSLLTDALDTYEMPRLEVEDNCIYIYTRFPSITENNINSYPVLFVICESIFISLSLKPLPFLDKFLKNSIDISTTQKTKLFLHMLLQINQGYDYHMHIISRKVRSTTGTLEKINNKDIIQLVSFESTINNFLSDLVPASNVLNKLLSGRYLKLFEEDKDLVEDLLLNNNQLIELSKSILKTIVNIREAYSTIVTNNLNRIIKLLTSLTVILTVPTMVASIYGMNVIIPFSDSKYMFPVIIFMIISIIFLLLWVFRKNDWL